MMLRGNRTRYQINCGSFLGKKVVALFFSDLKTKTAPLLEVGKVYAIRRRSSKSHNETSVNHRLEGVAQGAGDTKHYLFRSVRGGYLISFTEDEIKIGDTKIVRVYE